MTKLLSELMTGTWSGATAYTIGDIVTLSGSSYVCIANHTNQTPPNATYWALLAQAGTNGVNGEVTLSGAQTFTGVKSFTTGLLKAADIIDLVQALKVMAFSGVASAVNWVKVTSAATGNPPTIEPAGSDTNIDLKLVGKGTGTIKKPGSVVIPIVNPTTDITTGDGKFYFTIPPELNGMVLSAVHARVITAGTTGTTDIQLANVTDAVDILSTKLTIDSTETGSDTAATPAVINSSNDDMATNDLIRVDIDAVSSTPPKGLILRLTFGF